MDFFIEPRSFVCRKMFPSEFLNARLVKPSTIVHEHKSLYDLAALNIADPDNGAVADAWREVFDPRSDDR